MSLSLVLLMLICWNKSQTDTFDWEGTLERVVQQRVYWQQQNIDTYIYHFKRTVFNAHQEACVNAWKYILVYQNEVRYVEYDQKDLLNNDLLDFCINDHPILNEDYQNYFDMDFFYERAISHLQDGLETDCSDSSKSICGGGEIFEYDDRVHSIKKVTMEWGPTGPSPIHFEFGCLTSFSDWDSPSYGQYIYPGECVLDLSMQLELYKLFNPDDDNPELIFGRLN